MEFDSGLLYGFHPCALVSFSRDDAKIKPPCECPNSQGGKDIFFSELEDVLWVEIAESVLLVVSSVDMNIIYISAQYYIFAFNVIFIAQSEQPSN